MYDGFTVASPARVILLFDNAKVEAAHTRPAFSLKELSHVAWRILRMEKIPKRPLQIEILALSQWLLSAVLRYPRKT
jgi:hypothetical protein